MTRFRNTEEAFLALLAAIIDDGEEVTVRGSTTREIRSQLVEIEQPQERVIVIPGRNNSVFASIAESMWVLAGRDDVSYLEGYLKRARDFSDDGATWRGAYGPRLRNWHGADQLRAIVALLSADPDSRRAVASLYDPAQDMVESRDVPCNNWLHFLRRNGQLHLHVAARSTDIWWGFSGINIFEWALLLEMMAHWLGDLPGQLSFFTSSLHLYERHDEKARAVLSAAESRSGTYPSGPDAHPFTTPFDEFDAVVAQWMGLEQQLRSGANLRDLTIPFTDALLQQYIRMIDIYWAFKRGMQPSDLADRIGGLGNTDLAHAANEFVRRPHGRNH